MLLLIDAPVKQLQDYADLNDMMTMRSQKLLTKATRNEALDPEDYPDIHKMAILADVVPTHVSTTPFVRSSVKKHREIPNSKSNTRRS